MLEGLFHTVLCLDFQNLRISNTVCSTFWLHSHKDLLDIMGQALLGRTCHSCPQEWQHLRFPKYGDMLMEKESQTNSWPFVAASSCYKTFPKKILWKTMVSWSAKGTEILRFPMAWNLTISLCRSEQHTQNCGPGTQGEVSWCLPWHTHVSSRPRACGWPRSWGHRRSPPYSRSRLGDLRTDRKCCGAWRRTSPSPLSPHLPIWVCNCNKVCARIRAPTLDRQVSHLQGSLRQHRTPSPARNWRHLGAGEVAPAPVSASLPSAAPLFGLPRPNSLRPAAKRLSWFVKTTERSQIEETIEINSAKLA